MVVDIKLLRQKIAKKGYSISEFAKQIKMDPSTFYRKMESEGLKFSVGQMHLASNILELTKEEACAIFLSENSQ